MRKLIILSIVTFVSVIFSFTSIFSQDTFKISKGLKFGLNVAKVIGDDADYSDDEISSDAKYRIGFGVGGYAEFHVSPTFSIQPEFLYVQGGTKYEGMYLGEGWEVTLKVNYLEVPVLLKYKIPTQSTVKPSFYFGPTVSFVVDKIADFELMNTSIELDIKNVKSTLFGLTVGGEVELSGGFTLEGRFDYGLSKIGDDATIEDTEFSIALDPNQDIKNSSILFMVGYSF